MILRTATVLLCAQAAQAACEGCSKKLFTPTCNGFEKKTTRWGNWYRLPAQLATFAPTATPAPTGALVGAEPTPRPSFAPTPAPTPEITEAPSFIDRAKCHSETCCAEAEEDCCLTDPPRVLGLVLGLFVLFFLAAIVLRPRLLTPQGDLEA